VTLPGPLARLRHFAVSRPRQTKRWIAMLVDGCLCAITCYAAVILRLGFWPERDTPFGLLVAVSIAIAIPLFWALGLYREIFSQAGIRVTSIRDTTPIPHNGCRPPKRRRV